MYLSRLSFSSLLILTGLLLSSCATNYTISSNIDQGKIKHYFSPSHVKIYPDESEFNGRYHYLGMVDGEYCQVKANQQSADKITARTNARRKAFKLKANAIVFTGCSEPIKDTGSKQCISTTICYGKAYNIEQK